MLTNGEYLDKRFPIYSAANAVGIANLTCHHLKSYVRDGKVIENDHHAPRCTTSSLIFFNYERSHHRIVVIENKLTL